MSEQATSWHLVAWGVGCSIQQGFVVEAEKDSRGAGHFPAAPALYKLLPQTLKVIPGSSKVCFFVLLQEKVFFWLKKRFCLMRASPVMHVFLAWACAEKALFLGQKALLPGQNTLFLTCFAAILKKSSCWVKKRFLSEPAKIIAFSPNGGNVAHPECPGMSKKIQIPPILGRTLLDKFALASVPKSGFHSRGSQGSLPRDWLRAVRFPTAQVPVTPEGEPLQGGTKSPLDVFFVLF